MTVQDPLGQLRLHLSAWQPSPISDSPDIERLLATVAPPTSADKPPG